MIACTSLVFTLRSTPRTISVPSSVATCKFLISSRAKLVTTSPGFSRGPGTSPRDWVQCSDSPPGDPPYAACYPRPHAWKHRLAGRASHHPRAAARLRPEASSRDGPLAGPRHAGVQGLAERQGRGRRAGEDRADTPRDEDDAGL